MSELCTVTLGMQIDCVQRELQMRKSVYPRLVAVGKMGRSAAARQIETMEAVLKTLEGLREH